MILVFQLLYCCNCKRTISPFNSILHMQHITEHQFLELYTHINSFVQDKCVRFKDRCFTRLILTMKSGCMKLPLDWSLSIFKWLPFLFYFDLILLKVQFSLVIKSFTTFPKFNDSICFFFLFFSSTKLCLDSFALWFLN